MYISLNQCLYYRPPTKFAKVMFLHLSVILFTGGGCLPQCMLGYTSQWEQTTPWEYTSPPRSRHPHWSRHTGGSRHPQSRCPPSPRADTPWVQTPIEQTPILHSACWEIRPISGPYASYWNAYLFK